MALEWENLINGESEIVVDDINKLAKAIKDNEKAIEDTTKDLQQEIEETNQLISGEIENLQQLINDTTQSLGNDIEEKTIINDATNTSIRLNDSSDNNFRDIDIIDTTNNEVTIDVYGKNLIDADILATGFEKQSDGSYISITTIGRNEVPFYLPAGNTYTIRYLCKSDKNNNYRIRLLMEDETYWDTYIASTGEYQTHKFTKTLTSAVVGIVWHYSASFVRRDQ
jgi:hypothetical protein